MSTENRQLALPQLPRPLEQAQDVVAWLRDATKTTAATGALVRLCADSRRVRPGDAFIGSQPTADAATNLRFALHALAAGAAVAVVDAAGVDAIGTVQVAQLMEAAQAAAGVVTNAEKQTTVRAQAQPALALVHNLKQRAGEIVSGYLGQPSWHLRVCAVTGTNGKTSSAWWLSQALANLPSAYAQDLPAALLRCGVIGTLGVGNTSNIQSSGYTTPEPVLLHTAMHEMLEQGYGVCALEASSIGIAEHRLNAVQIHTAVFTNFTRDHLDYHGDMQAYWQAKRQLFAWSGLCAVVINRDEDKAGELMEICTGETAQPDLDVWTYSMTDRSARLYARNILTDGNGMSLDVVEDVHSQHVHVPVAGMHNVSNLLGVIATMRTLGVPFTAAVQACEKITAVPGRMDTVHGELGQPLVVVDFAHTPDAVRRALQALRPMCNRRGGRLWCVVGCGGNRDAGKRPLMAAMAEAESDRLILTSDNPRDEDPQHILDSMVMGLHRPQQAAVIVDRAQAIHEAVAQAAAVDVVLLAGKGHEAYQEIAGQRLPFSDHMQAEQALATRGSEAGNGAVTNGRTGGMQT